MLLPQQIQAILYHLMIGWLYGCTFSFLCSLSIYIRFRLLKGFVEILYHIVFILISFYGLYHINGGVTNLYLIAFFLLGIFLYYTLYLPVFMEGFTWFKRLFKPVKRFFLNSRHNFIKFMKKKRNLMKIKRLKKKQKQKEKKEKQRLKKQKNNSKKRHKRQ